MNRIAAFLFSAALVASLASSLPAFGEDANPADARLAASRRALEQAQQSLQQAEDTGGDIRSAQKSVANALRSLRAAEIASGTPPALPPAAAASPVVTPPPALPIAPQAVETPAKQLPAASADAGPKPYVPPTVPKPKVVPPPAAKSADTPPPAATAKKPVQPPVAAEATPPPPPKAAKPKRQAQAPVVVRRGRYIETTITHADGRRTIDVTRRNGQLVRRIEVDRFGNEVVVIDQERPNVRRYADPREVPAPDDYREVPPPGYYQDGY
ncbi:hypothetical protein [Kaistia algarum]|uniref:hypothetical protein n=1 Tax=Kaistia algarum TaxID=2083279 RepID=UPI001056FD17|nr:hypothetical protein [Kaistia algarum]MCX5514917.1 hypothetical protein [Kaistia algarum]